MKKVLSLVLAGSMILSSMSMAFAATPATTALKDIAGNDYEEAIKALVALDVVSGYEDATFRPAKTITRAELAKLLVEALGYGDLVAGAKANFADTQNHWSNGYVAIANGTGLVKGYPDGTFKPDQVLTYDEVYTMVVRALGYTDASLKGTWPTNFKVKAIDLGLTDDVKMATSAADRGGVAQAMFNALEVEQVTVDADNNVTVVKKGDVVQLLIDKIANLDDDFDVTPATLDKDSNKYAGNIVDLAQYMYQNLEVYMNDDDEVVFVKDSNSLVVTGTIDTTSTVYADNSKLPIKDAAGTVTKLPLVTSTAMFYNGAQVDDYDMTDLKADNTPKYESISVVAAEDTNDNDKIDAAEVTGIVVVQQTKVAVIDNEYKTGRTKIDVFSLPVDEDGDVDLDKITVTGDASALEDIAEDDVVVSYTAKDASVIKLVVSSSTVEGKVTRLASDAVYVDGTKYSVSSTAGSIAASSLALGDEGTFYLDNDNKVVYFDGETATPTDYAVVIAAADGSIDNDGRFDALYEIDDYPALKLATQNDEVVIYDVFTEIDEDDASVTDAATDEDGNEIVATSADETTLELQVTLNKGDLIKYSLNDDGQIESIEVVQTVPSVLSHADTTLASFKLADGAIIFDATTGEDFAVVSAKDLEDEIDFYGEYNDNGELEVIVTADVNAEAEDTTIAVIKSSSDVTVAKNSDGDKIQVATVYMNGEKQDVYTDGDVTFPVNTSGAAITGAYEVEFDGGVVVTITPVTPVAATVVAISASNDMVKLTIGTTTSWYSIAADATMLDIKSGTTSYEFIDLYDLDETDAIKVIVVDGEVTYLAGPALAAK